MKLILSSTLVVFCALFALTKSQNDDVIFVICKPSEDGFAVFVPHPYECSKFFLCQGTTGIAMDCPAGLQFDSSLNVCNYPGIVGCVNTPYPTTSTESTTMISTTTTVDVANSTTIYDNSTMIEDYDSEDYVL